MTRGSLIGAFAVLLCALALASAAAPAPARALNPEKTVCGIGSLISGLLGKACGVGGKVLGVGKKLFGGGGGSSTSKAQAALGLAAIVAWVTGSAKFALHETAKVIAATTSPKLTSLWFSAAYWRVAGIGALLTLPFLFAAAIQALLHSDLALLSRAALGYLPLSLLAVSIAAPVATLLLSGTDEMCALVSAAAGNAGTGMLQHAGSALIGVVFIASSPFIAFLIGVVVSCGALALWIELVLREAAVYVVVLMLPLAFSAFVWPARRVWAVRAVELLVALILSKFAIVAVLTLGGAALAHASSWGLTSLVAGCVLVIMATFAPWAMVRLLPLAELASGAAGSLRGESGRLMPTLRRGENEGKGAEARLEAGPQPLLEAGSGTDLAPQDRARATARSETEKLAEQQPTATGQAEHAAELDEAGDGSAAGPQEPPAGAANAGSHGAALGSIFATPDLSAEPINLDLGVEERGPDGVEGLGTELIWTEPGAEDDSDPLPPDQEPPDGRL